MPVREPPMMPYELMEEEPRPVRLSVMASVRRSIPIVLLTVIVMVGAAAAYGLVRKPTYTSEARLNVGGLNLTRQTIPGYTNAVTQLAVAYSRAIYATDVLAPIAKRSKLPPAELAERISATPIQDSPVIRIRATSKDPSEAVRLADLASRSLVSYAVDLNSGAAQSKRLLARYIKASRKARKARAAVLHLKVEGPQRRAAQTREDIAQLELRTAAALYGQSQVGQATSNLVQRLAPAAAATSDRASVLQQFVAGGLIAGLLIGVGLAVLRANRVTTRRLGAR